MKKPKTGDITIVMDFLYIFEDGTLNIGGTPSKDDLQSCDAGYLTIINLITKEFYLSEEWHKIQTFEEAMLF